MRSKSCPKCQGSMTQGYIAENDQGGRGISKWSEGAPIKKWWGIKAPKNQVEIATYRCNRCGYLEHYAEG